MPSCANDNRLDRDVGTYSVRHCLYPFYRVLTGGVAVFRKAETLDKFPVVNVGSHKQYPCAPRSCPLSDEHSDSAGSEDDDIVAHLYLSASERVKGYGARLGHSGDLKAYVVGDRNKVPHRHADILGVGSVAS